MRSRSMVRITSAASKPRISTTQPPRTARRGEAACADVEQRRDREQPIVAAQLQLARQDLGERRMGAVPLHHRPWPAGGATGVDDAQRIVVCGAARRPERIAPASSAS